MVAEDHAPAMAKQGLSGGALDNPDAEESERSDAVARGGSATNKPKDFHALRFRLKSCPKLLQQNCVRPCDECQFSLLNFYFPTRAAGLGAAGPDEIFALTAS